MRPVGRSMTVNVKRGKLTEVRYSLMISVTTSTANAYQRLILAALISRGVLQAPAVNQALILEHESIEEVTAPTRNCEVSSCLQEGKEAYNEAQHGHNPPKPDVRSDLSHQSLVQSKQRRLDSPERKPQAGGDDEEDFLNEQSVFRNRGIHLNFPARQAFKAEYHWQCNLIQYRNNHKDDICHNQPNLRRQLASSGAVWAS
jgi:hypothetical protein